ncbi:YdcF family protein [Apilactobacillus micheneri]|uniref:YdcF family protein n=1 Tax=Apilactobacillus micheneri TaxID=1899430 RepID=UPI001128D64A|nr:YdcF family protein [Apilactobacillus micheneri]TPR51027.1 YdcF family protein [Apilactobacillus micheneri]
MIYILLLTLLLSIVLSIVSYKLNKNSIMNGLFILSSIFAIIANLGYLAFKIHIQLIHMPAMIVFAITSSLLLLVYLVYTVILVFDGIVVWYYEDHHLANIFSLILGLIMISYPIVNHFIIQIFPNPFDIIIERIIEFGLFYIVSSFIAFCIAVILCNLNRPTLNQDYIIILGAGLVHGDKVGPILAARINKAINIYWQQIEKTNKHPFIICSGGQGHDETVSEGFAMCEYANQHGVNEADVTAEEHSINTMTNFEKSKEIIERKHLKIDRGIFVSSNYHVYRANRYAKIVGLPINGIGSKTKITSLSHSILREYFAIILNHKLLNLFIGLLIIVLTIFLYI